MYCIQPIHFEDVEDNDNNYNNLTDVISDDNDNDNDSDSPARPRLPLFH